ncbi:MAG: hypothetical protein K0S45_1033 [Nitrospira sp.]|jgi:hypothetical protein|nr:hypothetical protein [Nitrospira sp.]
MPPLCVSDLSREQFELVLNWTCMNRRRGRAVVFHRSHGSLATEEASGNNIHSDTVTVSLSMGIYFLHVFLTLVR